MFYEEFKNPVQVLKEDFYKGKIFFGALILFLAVVFIYYKEKMEKAFRLNPVAPPSYYYMNGAPSYALTGRSEDGIRMAKEMLARWPNLIYGHIQLAVFYAALGRDEEARAAALDVLRIDPKFSAQGYVKMLPYKDPALNARLLERLRKAGLPE